MSRSFDPSRPLPVSPILTDPESFLPVTETPTSTRLTRTGGTDDKGRSPFRVGTSVGPTGRGSEPTDGRQRLCREPWSETSSTRVVGGGAEDDSNDRVGHPWDESD